MNILELAVTWLSAFVKVECLTRVARRRFASRSLPAVRGEVEITPKAAVHLPGFWLRDDIFGGQSEAYRETASTPPLD